MNKGIALAGNLSLDHIKNVEKYPVRHHLTTIENISDSTGGLVCNCAITLAKIDPALPIHALGIVGEDADGDFVLDRLNEHSNISTDLIIRKGSTSFTDVMTERDGSRTFFHYRGANALLTPDYFDFSKLNADILHIGYVLLLDGLDCEDSEYPTALCRVLAEAKKANLLTSIDVVSEESDRFTEFVIPALGFVS